MSLDHVATVLCEVEGLDARALGATAVAGAVDLRREQRNESIADYAARLAVDSDERRTLVRALLVHETSFFRYPASFERLAALAATRPGVVRVLSAGCATGEETVSITVALLEAGLAPERFVVHGVDASPAAVAVARAGRYVADVPRGLSPAHRDRWFVPDDPAGNAWRVRPEVLARIRYETANLLDPTWAADADPYDAIFCRNLLVYLVPDARQRLLAMLYRRLREDGILFVGHAEVLVAQERGFSPTAADGAYALVRAANGATGPPSMSLPSPAKAPPAIPAQPVAARREAVPLLASGPVQGALSRARDLADRGRLDEALALLESEISRADPTAEHYHLLALIHRGAERAEEARGAVTRALYLDPEHVGALLLAALSAEERGDAPAARRLRARAARVASGLENGA